MTTGLVAKNYGGLKDVDVRFSGLHALIGPNDSGKSTILRALRTLSTLMRDQFTKHDGTWRPFDPGFDEAGGSTQSMLIRAETDDGAYAFEKFESLQMGGRGAVTETRETISSGSEELLLPRHPEGASTLHSVPPPDWRYSVVQALSHVHFLALSEDGHGHRAVAGIEWKKIRKFQAGQHRAPETRNVLGVALVADELGCDALIFARDQDRDIERDQDIELGIEAANATGNRRRYRERGMRSVAAGSALRHEGRVAYGSEGRPRAAPRYRRSRSETRRRRRRRPGRGSRGMRVAGSVARTRARFARVGARARARVDVECSGAVAAEEAPCGPGTYALSE